MPVAAGCAEEKFNYRASRSLKRSLTVRSRLRAVSDLHQAPYQTWLLSIHLVPFLFHSAPVIFAGSIAIECSSSFAYLREYRLGMDQISPDTQNLAEDSPLHPP